MELKLKANIADTNQSEQIHMNVIYLIKDIKSYSSLVNKKYGEINIIYLLLSDHVCVHQ